MRHERVGFRRSSQGSSRLEREHPDHIHVWVRRSVRRRRRGNGQHGRKGRPDVLPPAAAKHRETVRGMWRGHGSWGRETPGYGNNRLRRKRAGGAGREGAVTNSRSTLRVDFGRKIHDSESRPTIWGSVQTVRSCSVNATAVLSIRKARCFAACGGKTSGKCAGDVARPWVLG